MLGDRGIKPKKLLLAEDINKIERRVKSAENKLIRDSELPKDDN